jgi:hypothetical protein
MQEARSPVSPEDASGNVGTGGKLGGKQISNEIRHLYLIPIFPLLFITLIGRTFFFDVSVCEQKMFFLEVGVGGVGSGNWTDF